MIVEIFTIEVIKVPEGEAPDKVRKQWVGVELEGRKRYCASVSLISQDRGERFPAFSVDFKDAITRLRVKSPMAAAWFEEFFDPKSCNHLLFAQDEVSVISSRVEDIELSLPEALGEAYMQLDDILGESFPKMANAYNISLDTPNIRLNDYIDTHSWQSISTVEDGDVSLSALTLFRCVIDGDFVQLVEILGEELGHIIRNELRIDEPGDYEERQKDIVHRKRESYFTHMDAINEFFGWVGRIVFRDCYNPDLKLSHELYAEFGQPSYEEERDRVINDVVNPAIKQVQKLGDGVDFTPDGLEAYRLALREVVREICPFGMDSDDFFQKEIDMLLSCGGYSISDILDIETIVDEAVSYLTGVKEVVSDYEKSRLIYWQDIIAQASIQGFILAEQDLRRSIFSILAKEAINDVNAIFEDLRLKLSQIDFTNYFEVLFRHSREWAHEKGYTIASAHIEEILQELPDIIRMSDRQIYERFFPDFFC